MYQHFHRVEDEHWWFEARRWWLDRLIASQRFDCALDVGCGTGGNLAWLLRLSRKVVGVEIDSWAADLARSKSPDADVHLQDANDLEGRFAPHSFDLITCLSVLYHQRIRDVPAMFRAFARLLTPGGVLVVNEPAHPFLFRKHDQQVHGARRFRRNELYRSLMHAGFTRIDHWYFNFSGFLPALALAAKDRLSSRSQSEKIAIDLRLPPKWLNEIMKGLMHLEGRLQLDYAKLPIGVSHLIIARPS